MDISLQGAKRHGWMGMRQVGRWSFCCFGIRSLSNIQPFRQRAGRHLKLIREMTGVAVPVSQRGTSSPGNKPRRLRDYFMLV